MSYNDFSGNDTAPHPPPPPFGAPVPQPAQPPDDDEADDWFEPVTYDQTDYEDLDAYLAQEAGNSWPPAGSEPPRGEPAFPDAGADPGPAADPWESAAEADPYAYADSFAAPPVGERAAPSERAAPPPERAAKAHGRAAPPLEWALRARERAAQEPESPPEREPEQEWAAPPNEEWPPGPQWPGRRGRGRPAFLGRRPRWMLPTAVGLAAAAIGSGVVIFATGGTSRSPAGLPIFSPAPGMSASPAMTRPGTAGSGTPAGQPSMPAGQPTTPGASMPGTATPGTTRPGAAPGMTAPGPGSPGALSPPITRAQAQQVLTAYTAANNAANAAASDSLIATVETGSSLAIDRGIYQGQRARKAPGFPPFAPVSARYYIPLESPAHYPHWFAVRVSNAPAASPGTVTSREYIVFTQATPGGPWLDAVEPFLIKGVSPPPVALDANGYATAVTGPAGLALSPAAVSAATAAARDSGGGQPSAPATLSIDRARAALLGQLPKGSTAATRHAGTTERVYGLRTADGGALLFYDVAARLTVTASAGSPLRLTIPGWVAASEGVSQARLGYLEQFATYDPPAAQGTQAAVIADYSGIFKRV